MVYCTALAIACGDAVEPPEEPIREINSRARVYLDSALDIMQQWSVNKYSIDWPSFRERAFQRAGAANNRAETHSAIEHGLAELGDGHSYFIPPGAWHHSTSLQASSPAVEPRWPEGQRIDSTVGYLNMISYSANSINGTMAQFATATHSTISAVDTANLCGWIVDLRRSGEGWMKPMLAGVGPILGEGLAGSFVDPDSVKEDWGYEQGGTWVGSPDSLWVLVAGEPYELITSSPSVAVLTGPWTEGWGEAILVAFMGRPKTRSFGLGTAGKSTSTNWYLLSDGAYLVLAVSTFADRTGRAYGGVIDPDTVVGGWDTWNPTVQDSVVQAAQNWLIEHGDCGN